MQYSTPNTPAPDPSTRPNRLGALMQAIVLLLLLASFVSGVMVWWGKNIQTDEMAAPEWLHPAIVVHGSLNPFLCVLFGFLLCQHIRIGWNLRANVVSGLVMEAAFAGLILTGAALYYAGSAEWRQKIILLHHVLGVLLPLSLAGHWVGAMIWAKKHGAPSIPDNTLTGS